MCKKNSLEGGESDSAGQSRGKRKNQGAGKEQKQMTRLNSGGGFL